MKEFDPNDLKKLYIPSPTSHKGQNGKLLLIGGSHLFHAASLWALQISSRIVDMVFYASIPENNQIVHEIKKEFRNGIVIPREQLENYIDEADCILIGPGMVRTENKISNFQFSISNIKDIDKIPEEGEQTYLLTKYLLEKYPDKKWVIDAGALQMLDLSWLKSLKGRVVITPHVREFITVFGVEPTPGVIEKMAKEYGIIIVVKGHEDTICSPTECVVVAGGNAGMTKGGTGDVLAGLISALACKNDLFLASKAGSYFNKKAGESLYEKVGMYFNSSDLAEELPGVMKALTVSQARL